MNASHVYQTHSSFVRKDLLQSLQLVYRNLTTVSITDEGYHSFIGSVGKEGWSPTAMAGGLT